MSLTEEQKENFEEHRVTCSKCGGRFCFTVSKHRDGVIRKLTILKCAWCHIPLDILIQDGNLIIEYGLTNS